MILLGAVFSAVLGFMQSAPIMGIAVGVFSAGYFGAFYLSIVETTIGGRETFPDWPSFTSFIDDILMPYLRLLGLCLISFAPLLALYFLLPDDESIYRVSLLLIGLLFGLLYFPMAVAASLAFGNLLAASPHIVLPAIIKASPLHLGSVVALIAAFAISLTIEELGKHPVRRRLHYRRCRLVFHDVPGPHHRTHL